MYCYCYVFELVSNETCPTKPKRNKRINLHLLIPRITTTISKRNKEINSRKMFPSIEIFIIFQNRTTKRKTFSASCRRKRRLLLYITKYSAFTSFNVASICSLGTNIQISNKYILQHYYRCYSNSSRQIGVDRFKKKI